MPKAKLTRKPDAPATTLPSPAKGRARGLLQPDAIKPTQPELRWQRTQRYVWDKGGNKDGRR